MNPRSNDAMRVSVTTTPFLNTTTMSASANANGNAKTEMSATCSVNEAFVFLLHGLQSVESCEEVTSSVLTSVVTFPLQLLSSMEERMAFCFRYLQYVLRDDSLQDFYSVSNSKDTIKSIRLESLRILLEAVSSSSDSGVRQFPRELQTVEIELLYFLSSKICIFLLSTIYRNIHKDAIQLLMFTRAIDFDPIFASRIDWLICSLLSLLVSSTSKNSNRSMENDFAEVANISSLLQFQFPHTGVNGLHESTPSSPSIPFLDFGSWLSQLDVRAICSLAIAVYDLMKSFETATKELDTTVESILYASLEERGVTAADESHSFPYADDLFIQSLRAINKSQSPFIRQQVTHHLLPRLCGVHHTTNQQSYPASSDLTYTNRRKTLIALFCRMWNDTVMEMGLRILVLTNSNISTISLIEALEQLRSPFTQLYSKLPALLDMGSLLCNHYRLFTESAANDINQHNDNTIDCFHRLVLILIYINLDSTLLLPRKLAFYLIESRISSIHNAIKSNENNGHFQHESEQGWSIVLSMFIALENQELHLVDEIWPRLRNLYGTPIYQPFSRLLVHKAFNHSLATVRAVVFELLCEDLHRSYLDASATLSSQYQFPQVVSYPPENLGSLALFSKRITKKGSNPIVWREFLDFLTPNFLISVVVPFLDNPVHYSRVEDYDYESNSTSQSIGFGLCLQSFLRAYSYLLQIPNSETDNAQASKSIYSATSSILRSFILHLINNVGSHMALKHFLLALVEIASSPLQSKTSSPMCGFPVWNDAILTRFTYLVSSRIAQATTLFRQSLLEGATQIFPLFIDWWHMSFHPFGNALVSLPVSTRLPSVWLSCFATDDADTWMQQQFFPEFAEFFRIPIRADSNIQNGISNSELTLSIQDCWSRCKIFSEIFRTFPRITMHELPFQIVHQALSGIYTRSHLPTDYRRRALTFLVAVLQIIHANEGSEPIRLLKVKMTHLIEIHSDEIFGCIDSSSTNQFIDKEEQLQEMRVIYMPLLHQLLELSPLIWNIQEFRHQKLQYVIPHIVRSSLSKKSEDTQNQFSSVTSSLYKQFEQLSLLHALLGCGTPSNPNRLPNYLVEFTNRYFPSYASSASTSSIPSTETELALEHESIQQATECLLVSPNADYAATRLDGTYSGQSLTRVILKCVEEYQMPERPKELNASEFSECREQLEIMRWETIALLLDSASKDISMEPLLSSFSAKQLFRNANNAISSSTARYLPAILRTLRLLLPYLVHDSASSVALGESHQSIAEIVELLDSCWLVFTDININDNAIILSFLLLVFHPNLFASTSIHGDASAPFRMFYSKLLLFSETHPKFSYFFASFSSILWLHFPETAIHYVGEIIELGSCHFEKDHDNEIVADKFLASRVCHLTHNLNNNDPALAAVKHKKLNRSESVSRFMILSFVERLIDQLMSVSDNDPITTCYSILDLIRKLIEEILNHSLMQMNTTLKVSEGNANWVKKCYILQMLCILSRSLKLIAQNDPSSILPKFHTICWQQFSLSHHPTMRSFFEILLTSYYRQIPNALLTDLKDALLEYCNRPAVIASLIVILSTSLLYSSPEWQEPLRGGALTLIAPHLTSNFGNSRLIAQYFFHVVAQMNKADVTLSSSTTSISGSEAWKSLLLPIFYESLEKNSDCEKLRQRQKAYFDRFNPVNGCTVAGMLANGSEPSNFIQKSVLEELRQVFAEFLTEIRLAHEADYGTDQGNLSMTHLQSDPLNFNLVDSQLDLNTVFQQKLELTALYPLSQLYERILSEDYEERAIQMQQQSIKNNIENTITWQKSFSNMTLEPETVMDLLESKMSAAELAAMASSLKRFPFVLFASFVDKIPNLAGLCRTSEIFHIESLVIGNKAILKDSSFTAVSVTAERHLPIVEVKSNHQEILAYLRKMKTKGYTICALEQTSTSTDICEFSFPFKSVLILGKEREGVPLEILECVDQCIEIPQFGIIRSLNVHVSAAIGMYEYVRQHRSTFK